MISDWYSDYHDMVMIFVDQDEELLWHDHVTWFFIQNDEGLMQHDLDVNWFHDERLMQHDQKIFK